MLSCLLYVLHLSCILFFQFSSSFPVCYIAHCGTLFFLSFSFNFFASLAVRRWVTVLHLYFHLCLLVFYSFAVLANRFYLLDPSFLFVWNVQFTFSMRMPQPTSRSCQCMTSHWFLTVVLIGIQNKFGDHCQKFNLRSLLSWVRTLPQFHHGPISSIFYHCSRQGTALC